MTNASWDMSTDALQPAGIGVPGTCTLDPSASGTRNDNVVPDCGVAPDPFSVIHVHKTALAPFALSPGIQLNWNDSGWNMIEPSGAGDGVFLEATK